MQSIYQLSKLTLVSKLLYKEFTEGAYKYVGILIRDDKIADTANSVAYKNVFHTHPLHTRPFIKRSNVV